MREHEVEDIGNIRFIIEIKLTKILRMLALCQFLASSKIEAGLDSELQQALIGKNVSIRVNSEDLVMLFDEMQFEFIETPLWVLYLKVLEMKCTKTQFMFKQMFKAYVFLTDL